MYFKQSRLNHIIRLKTKKIQKILTFYLKLKRPQHGKSKTSIFALFSMSSANIIWSSTRKTKLNKLLSERRYACRFAHAQPLLIRLNRLMKNLSSHSSHA